MRKVKWASFVLVVIGLVSAGLLAADGDPPANPKLLATAERTREFTEQFLDTLVTGRPYEAFNIVRAVTPDAENDLDTTRASTEELFAELRPLYGRPIGKELIETRTLGQSFIRYDYLFKFERNAIHCRMIYYRPSNVWLPVGIWFNENLDELFTELGRKTVPNAP